VRHVVHIYCVDAPSSAKTWMSRSWREFQNLAGGEAGSGQVV